MHAIIKNRIQLKLEKNVKCEKKVVLKHNRIMRQTKRKIFIKNNIIATTKCMFQKSI